MNRDLEKKTFVFETPVLDFRCVMSTFLVCTVGVSIINLEVKSLSDLYIQYHTCNLLKINGVLYVAVKCD